MTVRKTYPALDVAKFVASLFVVAIHAKLLDEVNIPGTGLSASWGIILVARLAVPFFFATSSFLLFRKIGQLPAGASPWPTFAKFSKRLLRLWAFWFAVGTPMYFFMAFRHGEWTMSGWLWDIVFVNGGIFYGWFLPALFYGMAFLLFARRHLSQKTFYLLCVAIGIAAILPAYSGRAWSAASSFAATLRFQWPTSWATSIIPLSVGVWFADHEPDLPIMGRAYRPCLIWLLAVSLAGMFCEGLLQRRSIGEFFPNGFYPQPVMFSLYPALFALCLLLFGLDIRESPRWLLIRSLSIVMYLFQGTALYLCWQGFGFLIPGGVPSTVVYATSVFFCLFVGCVLLRMSAMPKLIWLRQAL